MWLLERAAELATLDAQWAQARRGRGGLAVVNGEPGAGKTSLLRAFVDAPSIDTAVLWGSCDPLSTPRPLGPLHDVAAQLDPASRAALAEAEQSHEIFSTVFTHLAASPTVLVVDDIHWADQGTVDLLRYVLRRIGSTRSMVLAALREDEVAPDHPVRALLGDVARSTDATSIALRPLSLDAITDLVGGRAVDAARIERLTGGNPFFVTEMLDQEGDEVPASVRDAILARTASLDAEAWDVAHLLAAAPEAIPDHLLAGLSIGLPPLRALDQAGLIRRGSRGVAFRHELCRLAIASTIPPGGEVGLHRRMLTALEASPPADAAVLTHHALGAGDAVRVLRYATDAARVATRSGARRQAAALLEIALDRGAVASSDQQAELLEWLAEEYYLIDRLDDAIAAMDRAMVLRRRAGDVAGVSADHHALSVYHWYNADRDVAERHAAHAIAVFDGDHGDHDGDDGDDGAAPSPASVPLGHAYAMQAYLAIHTSDLDDAERLVTMAAEIGERSQDRMLSVRAGLIDGICRVIGGDETGRDAMLELLGSADDHFDEVYSSGWSNLTYMDVEQRRLGEAAAMFDISLPLTVERELPICRVWQLGSRGRLEMMRGRWDDAARDADDVLAGPSAPLARTWPFLVRGLIALRRTGETNDDIDAAWELADRYGEAIRLLPAAAALVEQVWLTGIDDARLTVCRTLLDAPFKAGLEWARGDLASWMQRLDPDLDVTALLDHVAEPFRLGLTGRHADAAARWAARSAPYEQALGLAVTGDADDARAAVDILDGLGADAVAAKVRLDMRARGLTQVPARRRASTIANPGGLTSREVDVLRLLDEGLTNAELAQRLYISKKTVDHHVSAILTKLQVGNRRVATRTARELGLLD
ncbi:MAG: AAA family ATPase [Ilumatobacteraceae bacterium]